MNREDLQFEFLVTPASESVARQESTEAQQINSLRSAAVANPALPPMQDDPFDWGERKEGQSEAARRQEIVQIANRRRARMQGQKDMNVLSGADIDIDRPPPAQQDMHVKPPSRPQDAFNVPGAVQPHVPPFGVPGAAGGHLGPQSQASRRSPQRFQPMFEFQPDTSTQIPQPPSWRDTPERRAGGPTNQQPQQMTFSQAQMSFDTAVARQMQMMAGFVQDATRRIEELECWRESMVQE